MVALAALIYLPVWAIAAFGIVMIGTHNLFDSVPPEAFGSLGWLWNVLHAGNPIHLSPTYTFYIGYPLVPWIGVMAAGYAYGAVVKLDRARRRRRTLWLGISLCAAFVVIRARTSMAILSLVAAAEPALYRLLVHQMREIPSLLLYLLMTLGPSFIVLALLDRDLGKFWRPFIVFGRVPLFFYIVHIFLIHAIALFISYLRYGGPSGLFAGPLFEDDTRSLYPPDYGFGLAGVYVVWLLVVIALYPCVPLVCRVEARRRGGWLSYL
jgi:Predicted membrane protein